MDRLDSAPSGTTRNAVEGRQPNDRRKAGASVADDRDRPNRTPVASTIPGFHRKLPVCNDFLRDASTNRGARQPFGGSQRLPPYVSVMSLASVVRFLDVEFWPITLWSAVQPIPIDPKPATVWTTKCE